MILASASNFIRFQPYLLFTNYYWVNSNIYLPIKQIYASLQLCILIRTPCKLLREISDNIITCYDFVHGYLSSFVFPVTSHTNDPDQRCFEMIWIPCGGRKLLFEMFVAFRFSQTHFSLLIYIKTQYKLSLSDCFNFA